ncbi:hypothetical protein BKA14_003161 [Actinoplanes abujensis]|uniref:Uncharacterized protein n=1 Tax=Paractinoplanes abujensis TaxID=882441 RepID=A0A7W7CQX0_9ACTN|nr:hypothetical protein [Actinoplanes abujensis]
MRSLATRRASTPSKQHSTHRPSRPPHDTTQQTPPNAQARSVAARTRNKRHPTRRPDQSPHARATNATQRAGPISHRTHAQQTPPNAQTRSVTARARNKRHRTRRPDQSPRACTPTDVLHQVPALSMRTASAAQCASPATRRTHARNKRRSLRNSTARRAPRPGEQQPTRSFGRSPGASTQRTRANAQTQPPPHPTVQQTPLTAQPANRRAPPPGEQQPTRSPSRSPGASTQQTAANAQTQPLPHPTAQQTPLTAQPANRRAPPPGEQQPTRSPSRSPQAGTNPADRGEAAGPRPRAQVFRRRLAWC